MDSFKLTKGSTRAWPLFVAAGLFIGLGLAVWFTAVVALPGALVLIVVSTVKTVTASRA